MRLPTQRPSLGFARGVHISVKMIKQFTGFFAKPFTRNARTYPMIDLDRSDQEKISRDFRMIGKDLYMSLDEFAKTKSKHA